MATSQPEKANDSGAATAAASARTGHLIDAKHEPFRLYHVLADDDTIVERTAREVADASKMFSNYQLWQANFQAALVRVRAWCEQHAGAIRGGLVDIRSNKVLFYFIPVSDRYDLNLGNEMTQLEGELGNVGIGYVETLQVPARSIERFAAPTSLIFWQRGKDGLLVPQEAGGGEQGHGES